MELQTIEMEAGVAREALRQYRADVKAAAERSRTTADRELAEIDAAIMRGYRELARGNRILGLSKTVVGGGLVEVDARARRWNETTPVEFTAFAPAIAAIRADARSCWMPPLSTETSEKGFTFQADRWDRWRSKKADRLELPGGLFEISDEYGARGLDVPDWWVFSNCQLKAMVPTIPPALRPPHRLAGYVILWEAEWTVGAMIAPGDPALLKHLGGDMYALLAVWDLSPLERAVLGGARG